MIQSRRSFLKMLGVTGLVAATPKIIFDLAPQSYKLTYREFKTPAYVIKDIQSTAEFKDTFQHIVQHLYPRRYNLSVEGVFVPVDPKDFIGEPNPDYELASHEELIIPLPSMRYDFKKVFHI